MTNSKSSFKNPLARRIEASIELLESIATDLIQKKKPHSETLGKKVLRVLFPFKDAYKAINNLKEELGLHVAGSPEEEIAILIKSIIGGTKRLTTEYHQEQNNVNENLPAIYEQPIDQFEVVNTSVKTWRALDVVIELIEDLDLRKDIMALISEELEFQSKDKVEEFKKQILSIQARTRTSVNEEVSEYIFQKKGDVWNLRFGGEIFRLKHTVGFRHISTLLQNPSKSIRSDQLQRDKVPNKKKISQEDTDKKKEKEIPIQFRPQFSYTDYTDAIAKLESELTQIELGSLEYLQKGKEVEHVKKERSKNFNRYGKERPIDSGEKDRQAVGKAITNAKKKINHHIPDMVIHFTNYLHPGFVCIYEPPTSELKSWHF